MKANSSGVALLAAKIRSPSFSRSSSSTTTTALPSRMSLIAHSIESSRSRSIRVLSIVIASRSDHLGGRVGHRLLTRDPSPGEEAVDHEHAVDGVQQSRRVELEMDEL